MTARTIDKHRASARLALRCLAAAATLGAACATAAAPATPMDGQIMRPGAACPSLPTEASPAGWQQEPTLCAWQGRLQLSQWSSQPGIAGADCISPAVHWWAWERRRLMPQAATYFPVWHSGWRSNAALMTDPMRVIVIEAGPDGVWKAREWRWAPAPRAATRAWQSMRWDRLAAAAQAKRAPLEAAAGPAELPVLRAWQDLVQDRVAEISPSALHWLAAEQCFKLVSRLPAEPNFHLAFAREDARLEQRAAMQVQLARRYPDATWLLPFGLLELPAGAGAKVFYTAVWQDQTGMTGQLWMPESSDRRPVRLRILAAPDRADAAQALLRAHLIQRELTALALRLGANRER